ncbi:MAG: aminotransferase class V-fold PLP-dependent enzyme [Gemmatimonadaceae bacterium]|nr:aminotransferase class V-fold PLP-dependent enzyme [Gemmatimonadaceae bacterium]NUQ93599.1 aminotransferase class V-fold PLP-dependent enzyme [Gemmatimonadaceae bacterium]NUR19076.1 aminotransferase class V-fold PLP-dependent enzyme [Gemmatimonadaceae bacterium]NUS99089.1 aminotransferase class V-fold PLP-dependent enzyme [Gemmatimonadaceae bacterium]
MSDAIDVAALRRAEFPWADRDERVYLNNASTGPLTQRGVRAAQQIVDDRIEPFRIDDAKNFAMLERTRELVASLIGAAKGEIALMTNTSYGLNIAARALPFASGDVVLVHDREFPANVYPWLALEKRGVTLRRIPPAGALPDEEALIAAIEREPRVRAVSVSWIAFSTGFRSDLRRIGALCRERGIWFIVDAIQGLGADFLDVRECSIDIMACGGQKWLLSPWGSGFAYVRAELVPQLDPQPVGWMAVKGSDDFTRLLDYDLTWRDDARRFEVITIPFQDFAGLGASLELLHELGPAAVARRVQSLATEIVRWAGSKRDVTLVTPADSARRAGIVSIVTRDSAADSARLKTAGVAHSLREGALRLAPHVYNTSAEIERALEILDAG